MRTIPLHLIRPNVMTQMRIFEPLDSVRIELRQAYGFWAVFMIVNGVEQPEWGLFANEADARAKVEEVLAILRR